MTPHEATQQGLAAHQAGRLAEAESHYAAALKAEPDFHPALHLMGLLRFHQQDFAASYQYFSHAIAAAPPEAMVMLLANRAEVLLQMDRADEALQDFDRALAANPGLVAAWNNRGLALNALGRHDEALISFDRALALAPRSHEAHNNRGDTLHELRRFDDALASFQSALAIRPDDWATLNNRAVALNRMGRIDEALEDYTRALALEPNIPAALHARGNLSWSKKAQLGPAIADLERLIEIAPDYLFARGSLMRLTMTAARWHDYQDQKALLDEGVRAQRPVVEPFIYLALSERPEDQLRCARLYARTRFPTQTPLWKGGPRRPGRIRVGYVCGEFRTHATLYLMAGLFEAHDRRAFEIFAFDNGGGDGSPLRARFEAAVERVLDIRALSDRQAAARIRSEEIDILVDLNGYSGDQRLGIFAYRPAAVQVSYLAYPGTLGTSYMDYILADRVVIPEDEEKYYAEKIAWLPHSYQINDDKRAIAQTPGRTEAGLPAEGFVFCNFNHANKFTSPTFTVWMRILEQSPQSVLWLLAPDAIARENLKREAAQRGVAPGRLVFAETLPFEKHLARLKLADLFLDGLPYGAHTTASDALWAGLPLLTCRGTTFAGRVAASLLEAVGLQEMVTENSADFEALAVRLAHEPDLLCGIRKKLAKNRTRMPLFDTRRTTRDVETAWRTMFERRDLPPESFLVPPC
ncbi:MAG TPA: tetratricopeptide repeat protein [Rhizomicrobium sp.]|nr:tetratricopeptide repeat protein [Rhizomicrobium sp.]